MHQFIVLVQWTLAGLFALSVILDVFAWIYFLIIAKQKRVAIQVQFGDGQRAEAGDVPLTIAILGPVIRPLLGTIRARLVFAGMKMSDPVVLDAGVYKRRQLLRAGIRGTGKSLLHDRGIYDVEKVHLLFCDMFNLVALPYTMPFVQQLYTLPREQSPDDIKAQPHATEEQKHRIEIPKRVEGEYISYKEFETGDNIRRIVWKIYAKSGQLVVRIPETRDPYASHLYFYASFYEDLSLQGGIFDNELLNVYKDKVRNVLEAIQKNGYEVRMPKDQEVPVLAGMGDKKNELFQITAAKWQRANSPAAFVSPSRAAFVCLSSLIPVSEVEQLLKNLHGSVPVVIVKMSDAIPSPFAMKMKDFFFRPDKQPTDKLRNPWLVSPMRQRILKNEGEIRQALKKRDNAWLASTIDIAV